MAAAAKKKKALTDKQRAAATKRSRARYELTRPKRDVLALPLSPEQRLWLESKRKDGEGTTTLMRRLMKMPK